MAPLAVDPRGERLGEHVVEPARSLDTAVVAEKAGVVDLALKELVVILVARAEIPSLRVGIPANRHLVKPPFIHGDKRQGVVARPEHVDDLPGVRVALPSSGVQLELLLEISPVLFEHRVSEILFRYLDRHAEPGRGGPLPGRRAGESRGGGERAPHAAASEGRGNRLVTGRTGRCSNIPGGGGPADRGARNRRWRLGRAGACSHGAAQTQDNENDKRRIGNHHDEMHITLRSGARLRDFDGRSI